MTPAQISAIASYAPRFHEATQGLHYIRRGVFWSELLAFAALANAAGAEYVVETGTGLGFSARVLARLFPRVITIGLEDKPEGLPDNVTFVAADAIHSAWEHVGPSSAVLIDGPKHNKAVHLADALRNEWTPKVIAVHDCARGMPAREPLCLYFPGMVFTDEPRYVDAYGHLDKECLDMAALNAKTFPDHGPTLGIVTL